MSESIKTRAFVFPGQASQYLGMAQPLVGNNRPEIASLAKQTFEQAGDILGMDILRLCLQGPAEELDQTRLTQPAILTTSIAALRGLAQRDIIPGVVAGHSLGEYSALVAAGSLTFEDALKLVSKRGEFMEEAGLQNPGSMAAILRLSLADVREICQGMGVAIANINSLSQIVISGEKERVAETIKKVKEQQGVAIPLKVSIASHSPLMRSAQEKMAILLAHTKISDPDIPFIQNVTADYALTRDEVQDGLIKQMTGTVQFLQTVQRMTGDGVTEFIEVGPGKILTKIIGSINSEVQVTNTEEILK